MACTLLPCVSPAAAVRFRAAPVRSSAALRPVVGPRTPLRLRRFTVCARGKDEEPKKALYADDDPEEGMFKRSEMSEAQKSKLRAEYIGFGGSPSQPMGGNYFLNIILAVSFFAIVCAALGYI